MTPAELVEALKTLQTWSPEGDTPLFERTIRMIEFNLHCGQYDRDEEIKENK